MDKEQFKKINEELESVVTESISKYIEKNSAFYNSFFSKLEFVAKTNEQKEAAHVFISNYFPKNITVLMALGYAFCERPKVSVICDLISLKQLQIRFRLSYKQMMEDFRHGDYKIAQVTGRKDSNIFQRGTFYHTDGASLLVFTVTEATINILILDVNI
jgi:hypothetical protein